MFNFLATLKTICALYTHHHLNGKPSRRPEKSHSQAWTFPTNRPTTGYRPHLDGITLEIQVRERKAEIILLRHDYIICY